MTMMMMMMMIVEHYQPVYRRLSLGFAERIDLPRHSDHEPEDKEKEGREVPRNGGG
jgi:hypothetical protein